MANGYRGTENGMEYKPDPYGAYYVSGKPQSLAKTSLTRTRLLSADSAPDQIIYQEKNRNPGYYPARLNGSEDPEYVEVDYTDSRSPHIQMFIASSMAGQQPGGAQDYGYRTAGRTSGQRRSDESDRVTSQSDRGSSKPRYATSDNCRHSANSDKLVYVRPNSQNSRPRGSLKQGRLLQTTQQLKQQKERPPVEGSDSDSTPHVDRRSIVKNQPPTSLTPFTAKYQLPATTLRNAPIVRKLPVAKHIKGGGASANVNNGDDATQNQRNTLQPDGQSPESVSCDEVEQSITDSISAVHSPSSSVGETSSMGGMSPESTYGTKLFPDQAPSLGTLSLSGELEYDDYMPELDGSFFSMDPKAYTLTWSKSPSQKRSKQKL